MGIGKAGTVEEAARKVAQGVELCTNYEVVFYLQQTVPEFFSMISANADLGMGSKARRAACRRSRGRSRAWEWYPVVQGGRQGERAQ